MTTDRRSFLAFLASLPIVGLVVPTTFDRYGKPILMSNGEPARCAPIPHLSFSFKRIEVDGKWLVCDRDSVTGKQMITFEYC